MGVLSTLITSITQKVQGIITAKSNIRTAIIAKEVDVPTTAKLADYPDYIDDILIDGIDTTDATAAAGDILTSKTAYVNEVKVTGTMANNGAVEETLDVATPSYSVPIGYHSGGGTVSLTTQEKTATASHTAQEVTPDSGKVLSKVTVAALDENVVDTTGADALAANILASKTAYVGGQKVTGVMVNQGDRSFTASTSGAVEIPEGYYNGEGSVTAPTGLKQVKSGTNSNCTVTYPATGNVNISIPNLGFIPSKLMIKGQILYNGSVIKEIFVAFDFVYTEVQTPIAMTYYVYSYHFRLIEYIANMSACNVQDGGLQASSIDSITSTSLSFMALHLGAAIGTSGTITFAVTSWTAIE